MKLPITRLWNSQIYTWGFELIHSTTQLSIYVKLNNFRTIHIISVHGTRIKQRLIVSLVKEFICIGYYRKHTCIKPLDCNLHYVSNDQLSFPFQCSYYPPCKSSQIANDKSVSNYQQRFGVIGQSFSCLFNPVNPRQVIRTRRFHLRHVLHGTVWSSMICVASSSALVFIIKRRGCIYI